MKYVWDVVAVLDALQVPYVSSGSNVAKGNVNVRCPFCGDDPSEHLGINIATGAWGCWRDSSHVGRSPKRLLCALVPDREWTDIRRILSNTVQGSFGDITIEHLDTATQWLSGNAVKKETRYIRPCLHSGPYERLKRNPLLQTCLVGFAIHYGHRHIVLRDRHNCVKIQFNVSTGAIHFSPHNETQKLDQYSYAGGTTTNRTASYRTWGPNAYVKYRLMLTQQKDAIDKRYHKQSYAYNTLQICSIIKPLVFNNTSGIIIPVFRDKIIRTATIRSFGSSTRKYISSKACTLKIKKWDKKARVLDISIEYDDSDKLIEATIFVNTAFFDPIENISGLELSIGVTSDELLNYDCAASSVGKEALILCEGPFDALRLDVYGSMLGVRAVALSGRRISDMQQSLLANLVYGYKRFFIMLDRDALRQQLEITSKLATLSPKMLLIPGDQAKDPGEMTVDSIKSLTQAIVDGKYDDY